MNSYLNTSDIMMTDNENKMLGSTSPSTQDHSQLVSPAESMYHADTTATNNCDNCSEASSDDEDCFEENPTQEAEYMNWLTTEAQAYAEHEAVANKALSILEKTLPTIVTAPNGTQAWVEVCGSFKQGTMLSSSNLDVMVVFENDNVLPTQTIVDKLNDVTRAAQSGGLPNFTIKQTAKFQKQFRLKHIVLDFEGKLDVSIQIECRLTGQPNKTPGRACGDEAINRVLNLDASGKCRQFLRLMKIWSRKNELHGSVRMFNSSVEVLLALHTCQRLFLLPPLDEAKSDNITWTKPAGTTDPSFCRFFHEFRSMILCFAQEVVQREAFNMYVHFSVWKGSVTLDQATDKNHPPCEGRFRLYMENPAIHFIETEDAGIPAPTGNMAREITNGAWTRLLEHCGAPSEFLQAPQISPEEAAALRPEQGRIITPEEGKRLGKKRRKKARTDKVKEIRRQDAVSKTPMRQNKRTLNHTNSGMFTGNLGRMTPTQMMMTPMSQGSPNFNSPGMQVSPGMQQPMMGGYGAVTPQRSGSPAFNQSPQTWNQWHSPVMGPSPNSAGTSQNSPNQNGFMTPYGQQLQSPGMLSTNMTPNNMTPNGMMTPNCPSGMMTPVGQSGTNSPPNGMVSGYVMQPQMQMVMNPMSPNQMMGQNMDLDNPTKRARLSPTNSIMNDGSVGFYTPANQGQDNQQNTSGYAINNGYATPNQNVQYAFFKVQDRFGVEYNASAPVQQQQFVSQQQYGSSGFQ